MAEVFDINGDSVQENEELILVEMGWFRIAKIQQEHIQKLADCVEEQEGMLSLLTEGVKKITNKVIALNKDVEEMRKRMNGQIYD